MNRYAFPSRFPYSFTLLSRGAWLRTLALFGLFLPLSLYAQQDVVDISGTWTVRLADGHNAQVMLPGTTDTNRLGSAPADTTETTHLTRAYSYKGAAAYSRDIVVPKTWLSRKKVGIMHIALIS